MKQYNIAIEGLDNGSFQQQGCDTVLRAALRAGIGFPYECNSGGCGSCKYEVVSGEVENLWPEAPAVTERDRRKGRLLACQCRATSDLVIRMRPQPEAVPVIAPRRMPARLLEVREVTHDLREFRFGTETPASFLPGQYAMFALPGVSSPRAYSMSNTASGGREWHVQVRRVPNGKATEVLFEKLRPGDELEIDGPYGLAYLREDAPRDIVCVAGGSGLAPMVSIARGASQAGLLKDRHLHFFYGARTPRDVCGESFLRELPEFGERIHYHPVVSMPGEGENAWRGETGFVHELLRRRMAERMSECEFYFAGPPPMTNALQEMLMLEHRVPFAQIHFDRFF
ncbi:toluene monooxygenase electron transfer component [Solimonas aquatica]|uniref:Toluene monooxygenase electron transfer component n=1 Tax=Solimonas aquatica TaxID=489703 RepID=A0A1H9BKJ8_9GAMM|nr:toluene monooxygenase electron transfer component [Solimonas aquatica]